MITLSAIPMRNRLKSTDTTPPSMRVSSASSPRGAGPLRRVPASSNDDVWHGQTNPPPLAAAVTRLRADPRFTVRVDQGGVLLVERTR